MSLVERLRSRLVKWLKSKPPESDFPTSRVDETTPGKTKRTFWVTLFKIRW